MRLSIFFSLNWFRCRHLETNSDRLFKSVRWSACKMASFSAKQRLQRLASLVYANDLQTIDQVICGLIPLSLYFHIVMESSVAFALS